MLATLRRRAALGLVALTALAATACGAGVTGGSVPSPADSDFPYGRPSGASQAAPHSKAPDKSTDPSGPARQSSDPPAAKGPVIVLDPGHSGSAIARVDSKTGLDDKDYSNNKPEYCPSGPSHCEDSEVFTIAQRVKANLEAAGYTVVLTKTSVLGPVIAADKDKPASQQRHGVFLRDRATIATDAHAALAVSIHDDHTVAWGSFAQVYAQKDLNPKTSASPKTYPYDLYRVGTRGKVTLQQTLGTDYRRIADASGDAAATFVSERTKAEGHTVTPTNVDFGKRDLDAGNLCQVQLYADVPWVYNEVGAKGELSASQMDAYTKGLTKAIMKAVPIKN